MLLRQQETRNIVQSATYLPFGRRPPSSVTSPESKDISCFEPLMAVKATTTSVGCRSVNVGQTRKQTNLQRRNIVQRVMIRAGKKSLLSSSVSLTIGQSMLTLARIRDVTVLF